MLAKIYLYADDAKLYKHVRDSGNADLLQQEINNILRVGPTGGF